MIRRSGKKKVKFNRRYRSIGRTKKKRILRSNSRNKNRRRQRTKRRRQRTKRRRQINRRQQGGFTTSVSADATTSVSADTTTDLTTSVATSEPQAVAQDCNLRNDSNMFQSTFDNVANSVLPKIDNYLLVNNDVYVAQ